MGLAIARALGLHAPSTLILTSRDPESPGAVDAKRELESIGARVELEHLDPGDPASIGPFARRMTDRHPMLDVLVHNASAYEPSPLASLNSEQLDRAMRINAFAPAMLTGELRAMLSASNHPGGAGVVAMVDMHVLGRPRKDLLAYSMSKAALVEAVRTLARELAPRVRVNAVAPGVVAWPEQGSEAGEAFQRAYLARVPLERAGTPEDAAETVRWLALDARYVTGEIVRVDGGRWLA